MAALPPPEPELSRHPVDVGQRSEAAILGELSRRGYRVFVPFGFNHRCDLILDMGDRILRVQCKTGRLRNGTVIFSAQSVRSNRRGVFRRSYEGDVDLFAVYCPELDRVYAVPIEVVPCTEGWLRVDPTANNQCKRVRWAADFELPA
jgi:PD-(D/E)XK endonuclease